MKRLALAAALFFVGCAGAPPRVSLGDPSPTPTAKDYVDQLKKWTRHANLRSDFDAALDVDATLRAPEFRYAYAAKYIELYRIGEENQARVRGEILTDGADSYEFHVETATHDYALNDLTSTKSIWRLTLADDQGHEVTPASVTSVKERRQLDMEFYPYASIFSRGWVIRFPRARADGTPLVGGDTKTLTFRFAGPQGSVDLLWVLK
ncbi:MAG: hypothetical protein JWN44_2586 [Myxococcales bacterium]|nr:hypothetical protein [Myxococcales bacterium]